jgi:hypothetical protein
MILVVIQGFGQPLAGQIAPNVVQTSPEQKGSATSSTAQAPKLPQTYKA